MTPNWYYFDSENENVRNLCNPVLGDLLEYGLQLPKKIAVSDHRQHFTFAELDQLSRQMSLLLRERFTLKPGQRVMILTQKNCLVPAVAIALWQLGVIYAPFDGDSPIDRIASVAKQLQPALVIDFNESRGGCEVLDCPRLTLAELQLCSNYAIPSNLSSHQYKDDDVVYILHTSGSTGQPKGVQITERNLKSYFRAHNQVLQFNRTAKVFSLTPFHFDVSIEDTLLPLSVGATVYQYNRLHQGALMCKTLVQQNVSHLIAVSTILTMISEDETQICRKNFPQLSMVMTGAEVCAPKVINLWKQRLPETRVINAYGPTEVTIVATCHTINRVESERELAYPIGRPLSGVNVLLLDEHGQDVMVGKAGELCLGGDQVMLGYLNRPQENEARLFIRDGIRYYRTGDICVMNPDGNLQFVGREDGEVKINGRRIHLGEIQQQCMAVAEVERAAVGVHQQDGKTLITAVLISVKSNIVETVKVHLMSLLPPYMMPVIWGVCTKVTLSASGKNNDKQLLTKLGQKFNEKRQPVIYLNDSQGVEGV